MNTRINVSMLLWGLVFITIALLGVATGAGIIPVETATRFVLPIAVMVIGAVGLVLARKN